MIDSIRAAATTLIVAAAFLCAAGANLAVAVPAAPPTTDDDDYEKDFPEEDPYTRNDKEAMAEAGYLSFGPFPFADGHDTAAVKETLGGVPILWVETAHFKLGTNLGEYKIPGDKEERKKLKAELKELKEFLPRIKPTTKKLDPWLRLHLYAYRLEKLYEDFQGRLGLTDADFERTFAPGAQPVKPTEAGYLGKGPYLGQQAKYTVILFERASHMGRYASTYAGQSGSTPIRHLYLKTGSMFYGLAAGFYEGQYRSDSALHCIVEFSVANNLIDGHLSYAHPSPRWWREGLGHWYRRKVDPRWMTSSGELDPRAARAENYEWEPRVRGRVEHKVYPSTLEMFAWDDQSKLQLADHMIAWSRAEFLMSLGDEAFAKFQAEIKRQPLKGRGTPVERLLERQKEALRLATGMTPEGFDEAWAEYVMEEYSRK